MQRTQLGVLSWLGPQNSRRCEIIRHGWQAIQLLKRHHKHGDTRDDGWIKIEEVEARLLAGNPRHDDLFNLTTYYVTVCRTLIPLTSADLITVCLHGPPLSSCKKAFCGGATISSSLFYMIVFLVHAGRGRRHDPAQLVR
jgi:hypothetical protein